MNEYHLYLEEEEEAVSEPATPKSHFLTDDEVSDWGNGVTIKDHFDAEEEQAKQEEAEEEIEEIEEAEEEQPVISVEDPGEFQPKDYSFDVTVYDEEGKNGKAVKIKSVDDWDELLEKDPNLGSAANLMKAQRKVTKMESGIERDKELWERAKSEFDRQTESEKNRIEATDNMVAEINYLISQGDLPEIPKKYQNADWSDPDVAKQDGVKEQIVLLSFMRNENNERKKAGLKPMTSVLDAFNAFERKQIKKQAIDAKKQAGEARKAAGARVAGVSPSPVSRAPKGIMVGRAGSLQNLGASGW